MLRNLEKNDDTIKEMVYFLTHTLNNSFGTVPSTLRDIIERLSPEYEQKTKLINKLASLLTTFSVIETLIKTFRLYLADQQIFESSWHQDNQGESHIELVLALALCQTVSSVLFSPAPRVKRLLPSDTELNIKALRESFMNEIMVLELDSNNTDKLFLWLTQNLNVFSFELEKTNAVQFQIHGIRFTFLFTILSELIYNALKYSNGEEKIAVTWRMTQDYYEFTIRNTFNPDSRYKRDSTQKGLLFVNELMNRLSQSTIEYGEEKNLFTVKLAFHKTNFEDNTHANIVN
jgi:signal transduction histidine kinase